MTMHTFKRRGDAVTVCYMKPSTELSIEGPAKVRYLIRDVDEQSVVEFDNEPGENYERFVDAQGQENPEKYVREFNKKIGMAA
jgi:hypothetical protein